MYAMGSSQSDGLLSSVCESLGTRPNETKKASSSSSDAQNINSIHVHVTDCKIT